MLDEETRYFSAERNRRLEQLTLVQALWEAYEFRTELGDVAKTINNDSERFAKAWMAYPNIERDPYWDITPIIYKDV